ncbi:hypothetical protein BDB01DRAFT_899945 [Pilobolus umbonatus]|nr:hypothetical protein BDB01DRAFT_899945 [Pilobolus umbonatus]
MAMYTALILAAIIGHTSTQTSYNFDVFKQPISIFQVSNNYMKGRPKLEKLPLNTSSPSINRDRLISPPFSNKGSCIFHIPGPLDRVEVYKSELAVHQSQRCILALILSLNSTFHPLTIAGYHGIKRLQPYSVLLVITVDSVLIN